MLNTLEMETLDTRTIELGYAEQKEKIQYYKGLNEYGHLQEINTKDNKKLKKSKYTRNIIFKNTSTGRNN